MFHVPSVKDRMQLYSRVRIRIQQFHAPADTQATRISFSANERCISLCHCFIPWPKKTKEMAYSPTMLFVATWSDSSLARPTFHTTQRTVETKHGLSF